MKVWITTDERYPDHFIYAEHEARDDSMTGLALVHGEVIDVPDDLASRCLAARCAYDEAQRELGCFLAQRTPDAT